MLHVDKTRNTTLGNSIQTIRDTILDMKSVTGVVYLTSPVFTETSFNLARALNGTREFVYASFDFSSAMMPAFTTGTLHYSVSSMFYLQTLIPILLLYIQVRYQLHAHTNQQVIRVSDRIQAHFFFACSHFINLL